GYLSLHAGWAESGRAVAWMLAQARAAGVEVREGVRVSGLLERGSRVAGVRTEDGDSIEAARVVVAAGAWTPVLLPWLADRLRVVGQPVFHLRPRDAAPYVAARFPPWAADIARTGWYGFPAAADGIVKVANHGAGVPVDPRARPDVPAVWEAHLRDFLVDARPDLADAHIAARRLCLYCDAFDGDFWIAADPAREGLVVAAGGSGHGFKFAPVLGEIVANVLEGRPDEWAPRFAWREAGARRREAARWDPERPTT
ncbi:MAG: FAD-dependent oxidoreductase, partial [Gemmatimonadetes bacterium]